MGRLQIDTNWVSGFLSQANKARCTLVYYQCVQGNFWFAHSEFEASLLAREYHLPQKYTCDPPHVKLLNTSR